MVYNSTKDIIKKLNRKKLVTSSLVVKKNCPKIFQLLSSQIQEISFSKYDEFSSGKWFVNFEFLPDMIIVTVAPDRPSLAASSLKEYIPYAIVQDKDLKLFLKMISGTSPFKFIRRH